MSPVDEQLIKPTPRAEIDIALAKLGEKRRAWARTSVDEKLALLARAKKDLAAVSERWVALSLHYKGGEGDIAMTGQEWLAGPYATLRNISLLERSLNAIARHGKPQLPSSSRHSRPLSRALSVPVFPTDLVDRLMFMGARAEVHFQSGVTAENLAEHMASAYAEHRESAAVCLVLGGGNVSSIGPMDCLYKLFNEGKLCILKIHPVNGYLGPVLSSAFACFIEAGFLALVYGGAEEGSYLCNHKGVDEIHITGSDKTHDLIVFGPNVAQQKARRAPLLDKPITSELGNVSPVIVVPGDWSTADLKYHAINIVSSLANNAGFNCNATRVLITQTDWPHRQALLDLIRAQLAQLPSRKAYYPGAKDRFSSFLRQHPEAESFGNPSQEQLPWMFIPNVPAGAEQEICFETEAFCGVFAEVPLAAESTEAFIEKATHFANERLWGTLNATLLVHPKSLKNDVVNRAFERAIDQLRYGTVAVNLWAAVGYALCSTTWGAYPGHDIYDIRSGLDVVHNTYMLDKVEKSVLRGPFRQFPVPPYFITHRTAGKLGRSLCQFEANRSLLKLFEVFAHALRS